MSAKHSNARTLFLQKTVLTTILVLAGLSWGAALTMVEDGQPRATAVIAKAPTKAAPLAAFE